MLNSLKRTLTALGLVSAVSGVAVAKVSPEEAARLGNELTPFGAEKAGVEKLLKHRMVINQEITILIFLRMIQFYLRLPQTMSISTRTTYPKDRLRCLKSIRILTR